MNEKQANEEKKRVELLLVFSRGAKSRTSILKALYQAPKNCNQLALKTGLDWWAVQKHLQHLLSEKLVNNLSFGQQKFYNISSKGEEALRFLEKTRK